jgi:hypothetical protein
MLDTFRALFRPFYTLMLVIFTVYYVWAQVGIYIWGGLINNNQMELISNPNFDGLYTSMNMNDLVAGMITLFALMVVNNWFVVVETFTIIRNNYWRWYFILFYIVCVNLILNIVVAFVLDMYSGMQELQDARDKKEKEEIEARKKRRARRLGIADDSSDEETVMDENE